MNETTNSAEHKTSAYIHIPFCEHIIVVILRYLMFFYKL